MCRMKILFLSDIHGVPSTLEQALATAAPLGYDRIVLLGDLLYHGPRNGVPSFYDPEKVAAIPPSWMLGPRRSSLRTAICGTNASSRQSASVPCWRTGIRTSRS